LRGTGAVLNANSHRILNQEQDWLNLDQLVELWTQMLYTNDISAKHGNKVEVGELPQPHERVSVFWRCYCYAQSKVELSQEEFYQEIKIRTLE